MEEETRSFTLKEQGQLLKRLLSYIASYKVLIVCAIVVVLVATTTNLIGPYLIKQVVDTAYLPDGVVWEVVYELLTLYIIFALTNAVFQYLSVYIFNDLGFRLTRDLRQEVYTKLQGQGMRYFDQTPVGSIVSRVTNDTEAIQEMLNQVFSVVINSLVLIVGTSFVVLRLNLMMGLICLLFIPLAGVLIYFYQKFSTKFYMIAREKLSQLNTRIAESISGMNIIQVFAQEKRIVDEFSQTNEEYFQASLSNIRLNGLMLGSAVNFLTALIIAGIFAYGGILSFDGLITAGLLVAYYEYVYRFVDPIFQIMDRLVVYQQALVSAHRVFVLLDDAGSVPTQESTASGVIEEAKIEFKDITFSYDGEHDVLHNISFTVNPGETVALVGHTGSGKSSIINVMMRFYDYTQGDILIDGKSLKSYPMEELRKKMGLVLQEPFLYYGTISDNIRLKNKNISDEEIRKACEFVQADDFIRELDGSYNHKVIERGAAFSTGQKQLLAFARTIAYNPKILILDEATANIDTETESLIQEGLSKLRKGRTSIMIAHRLSTIKDANQILVLEKGEIVERGTHDELLLQKGVYHAMYEMQQQEQEF